MAATTLSSTQAEIRSVSSEAPFLADDGSIIRNLSHMGSVQSVHCLLPKDGVIQACIHKTVEQIWFVTAGEGEMWLRDLKSVESINSLSPGVSLTVPLGFSFQFRNTGNTDLEIFIVNTTPWSGLGELIPVENHWTPHFPSTSA